MEYVRYATFLPFLATMLTKQHKHSFFSIRWKAGLFFGSLFLLFLLVFDSLIYWNIQQKFSFFRSQIQEQYHQKLLGQIATNRDQLQRLAELLLTVDDLDKQFSTHLADIKKRIYQFRSDLELNWDVSQMQLYDDQGNKLAGWGPPIPTDIKTYIAQTAEKELAVSELNCVTVCKQYQLLPILTDTDKNYVLVMGYDITQSLLNFQSQTGADIAIISDQEGLKDLRQNDNAIWDRYINILTSYSENIDYLHYLAAHYSYNDINKDKYILRDSELPVEFQFIKLKQLDNVLIIIIDNITDEKHEITALTYKTITWSLIGLIIIAGSLFLLFSSPLHRLASVSKALPLLAEKQYDIVRSAIKKPSLHHRSDELDILEKATIVLSEQLEELEISMTHQTDSLNKRTQELVQERDFVSNLISTAQLIIITLDKEYRIISFNELAERITGYRADDVMHHSFKELFDTSMWSHTQNLLKELPFKGDKVVHMESDIITAEGHYHTISWIHSNFHLPKNNAVTLSVGIDITEKKQNEVQLLWLDTHDPLTELYNRKKLKTQFDHVLKQASFNQSEGVLLLLDLDHFKDINDTCGHSAGDQLLKDVSRILEQICRDDDVLARLGGDEFAIILPDTDLNTAISICEKISNNLRTLQFVHEQVRYTISSSIGIITFPHEEFSVDKLISNADLAMYQAKSHGKNTWHLFTSDDELRTQLQERMRWKQKIEDALDDDRFLLYFQPIMNIEEQSISHYEVLLRMQDAEGNIHSPAIFIEVAEQTGLIHRIDHYVLEKGIIKLAELTQENRNLTLSLNLSAHAMVDNELIPLLKHLLHTHNANPNQLLFELTETAAVGDITQARHLMNEMQELGCRFSIDDFGSGFASFRYLRELPVDMVKIDGMFITHITENNDDRLFVEALVTVAQGMGKKTIAEFVENAETLALLKELHVDYAQGYYIGKPQPKLLDTPPKFS